MNPYRTPEYRALVREARADATHRARAASALARYLEGMAELQARAADGRLAGWAFSSPEAFVLANGRPHTPAARPPGLRKQRNRLCYSNATHLAVWRDDFTYVEGYALPLGGIPTLHAWCVTDDGVVVDPTWHNPDLAAYYGVEIPGRVVRRAVVRHGVYGVLANDWKDGNVILRTGRIAGDEGVA